ncbi:MAG: phenylalanine--tRNA ligase subunit alpha [Armatimonadetes bacterium]|nr:phenylalanine--tRNA ligase subunit alpha [Armatimonadota bacterium]
MIEKLKSMAEEARAALQAARTGDEVEAARVRFLGRKGELRELQQGIKDLPDDQRPEAGKLINQVKRELEELLQARLAELAAGDAGAGERLDVTLPGRAGRIAGRHPLMQVRRDMIDIFLGMGYRVAEGPEIENYHYAFEALNYPDDHPAMDEQMTFYIEDDVLLRSQTSTVQIRVMETRQPPVRVVVPGRCFRRDTVDATHSHTFHQLEGLCVDEGITFADLKGTLLAFARGMFGPDVRVRFRPDFFPFTEPSAEFAVSCYMCGGKGCRVCSQTGWLELGGAGMVDPNVLAGVGYDTERYTGFAFGVGIERFTMLRYGIEDMRLLYSGDVRMLGQF